MSARAVFFSELWTRVAEVIEEYGSRIGRGGRAAEQGRKIERDERASRVQAERERAIMGKRGGSFHAVDSSVPSTGTHVESAKRSRSCVKCLDITVLFRLVRSVPLSRFCNSILFTPLGPFRCEQSPFPSLSSLPARADLMTLPVRFHDRLIARD